MTTALLEVSHLCKTYQSRSGKKRSEVIHAVEDVSFSLPCGTTLGIVGESGSGKTTVGKCILQSEIPDSGDILFEGVPLTPKNIRAYRSRIQIIFQNSSGSLDPKLTLYQVIAEGIRANKLCASRAEERARIERLITEVGLDIRDLSKYPTELSGGQQQRVGIARALAVDPTLLVCDEPVSALDVSYQAQIINLLADLQERRHLSYLFISHDLSVVSTIADAVAVMFHGRIVEYGKKDDVFFHPLHPYTRELLAAVPVADPELAKRKDDRLLSSLSSDSHDGCPYCHRCGSARAVCQSSRPALTEVAPGHHCACFEIADNSNG